MAILIRCSHCQKKLSVDEAFAGSLCRCIHCGALSEVPAAQGRDSAARPARPASPGLSVRPTAPPPEPTSAAREVEQASDGRLIAPTVAVAEAKFRGMLALLFLAAGVLLIAAAVWALIVVMNPPTVTPPPETPPPELVSAKDRPHCFGVTLTRDRIVYCVDCGSGMGRFYDYLVSAMPYSINSLKPDQQAGAVIWAEGSPRTLDPQPADASGKKALKEFLAAQAPSGATDPKTAIEAALAMKPGIVMVISPKEIIDDAVINALADKARQAGVVIHTFAIEYDSEPLKALAEKTDGEYKLITIVNLEDWIEQVRRVEADGAP